MADKSLLCTDIVVQIGMIVKDVAQTSAKYAAFFGVDIPQIDTITSDPESQSYYHGEPMNAVSKQAFFKIGTAIELELIEPVSGASTWQEHLDTKGEGVHHIAFAVHDMPVKIRDCEDYGMQLIQQGNYVDADVGRYSYVASDDLKIILELLEDY
ncbi:MAG: VOC family protein [Clostridiales Family XIII bacterium]|jgi:4-hydroxyphenylpyruvate dioxygenase-like putative hemolysin|nr:VOC family protein [Clostridiales Family XIII bacterium]